MTLALKKMKKTPLPFFLSFSRLGLPAQTHCSILFHCKLCRKRKESSASHPDTCIAKCLDLSSDLCPHWDCLLKLTILAQSYLTANFAMGKGVPVTMTHTLQKANTSVFLLILVTSGTACSSQKVFRVSVYSKPESLLGTFCRLSILS